MDVWKKAIAAALVACALFLAGFLIGRNSVHSDGEPDGNLDAGLVQAQDEQRDAAKSIDDAAGAAQSASDTADRIQDGNRESKELAIGSGDVIDELQRILNEIRGTKREN